MFFFFAFYIYISFVLQSFLCATHKSCVYRFFLSLEINRFHFVRSCFPFIKSDSHIWVRCVQWNPCNRINLLFLFLSFSIIDYIKKLQFLYFKLTDSDVILHLDWLNEPEMWLNDFNGTHTQSHLLYKWKCMAKQLRFVHSSSALNTNSMEFHVKRFPYPTIIFYMGVLNKYQIIIWKRETSLK